MKRFTNQLAPHRAACPWSLKCLKLFSIHPKLFTILPWVLITNWIHLQCIDVKLVLLKVPFLWGALSYERCFSFLLCTLFWFVFRGILLNQTVFSKILSCNLPCDMSGLNHLFHANQDTRTFFRGIYFWGHKVAHLTSWITSLNALSVSRGGHFFSGFFFSAHLTRHKYYVLRIVGTSVW